MTNLPKRKKGELNINIELKVDTNGILHVRATETIKGKSKEITIKNITVGLSDEDLEEIKKKNQKLYKSITREGENTIDHKKLKEEIKEAENCDDLIDKYDILMSYSKVLIKNIDEFGKNLDNETLIEKYYLYIQQLFNFYIKILCMKGEVTKEDEETIIKNIKKYIGIIIEKSPLYLDNLVRIINKVKKQDKEYIFYDIIIYIFEELKKLENRCSKTENKFCKHHSLLFLGKIITYFKEYIIDIDYIPDNSLKKTCVNLLKFSYEKIAGITSGACKLCEEYMTREKLIVSNGTGYTYDRKSLQYNIDDEEEKLHNVINNFGKILLELGEQNTIKKAKCLANMVKIGLVLLGQSNYKYYYELGKKCINIIGDNNAEKCKEWYKEFKIIFKDMENRIDELNKDNIKERVISKNQELFDEIEDKYNNCLHSLEFIKYILQKHPYKEYEEGKNINFNKPKDLLKHLESKYSPDQFKFIEDTEDTGNEKKELEFCIYEKINSYLKEIIREFE